MSNEITTKITKLYWKGIIDNCTNRKWWKNKWIVFDYGHFKMEISIYSINVEDNRLSLWVNPIYMEYKDNQEERKEKQVNHWYGNLVNINIQEDNYNETVFNKQLLSSCLDSIDSISGCFIEGSVQYNKFLEADDTNYENAREIAVEFLNQNNITNEDIRDAYIDAYANKVKTDFAGEYEKETIPTMFVEERVALCYFLNQPERVEEIQNHKRCNIIKIRTAVKKTMSEAYIEDMKEELEEI